MREIIKREKVSNIFSRFKKLTEEKAFSALDLFCNILKDKELSKALTKDKLFQEEKCLNARLVLVFMVKTCLLPF